MGLAIDDAIRQIILIIEGIKEFYESSNDILLDSKNLNRF